MSTVINTTYSLNKNFWKDNDHLLVIEVFKQLYNKDKSENKQKSSKIMWAIHFVYDYKSKFAHLSLEDRIEYTGKNLKLIENEKNKLTSSDSDIQELISMYNKLQEDAPIKFLREWEHLVYKRSKYLESIDYDILDIKEISEVDKIILNSDKILEQRKRVEELVREREKGRVRGNQNITLNAKGKLINSKDQ